MVKLICFLLCLMVAMVAATVPAFTQVSCTVTKNDYPSNGCTDTIPTVPPGSPTKKRADSIYSCNISPTMDGYGQIQISFSTSNGTVTAATCNTYQCKETKSKSDVISWLQSNYQGRNIATCYYQTNNSQIAYVDANGICAYQGTAQTNSNGSISCNCDDNWTGDTCSTAPPYCGNGVCEQHENCSTCSSDCSCPTYSGYVVMTIYSDDGCKGMGSSDLIPVDCSHTPGTHFCTNGTHILIYVYGNDSRQEQETVHPIGTCEPGGIIYTLTNSSCGNGICESQFNETCATCPTDCHCAIIVEDDGSTTSTSGAYKIDNSAGALGVLLCLICTLLYL